MSGERRMDWDDIRSFLEIARTRSLSGAARELGVRQSTMSRRLEALEARAGARLLQRTPSGYEMTALGEAVLGNAERMEAEAIGVERVVQGRDVALSGMVRLTTVEIVADHILPEAIARLQARYPLITVDVLSETRTLNLSRREADIAIRMARFTGNELVGRRLASFASAAYASAAYLASHGDPLAAGADATGHGHAIVTVLEDQADLAEPRWLSDRLPNARIALRSNNRSTQMAAVRAGLGVGCLPRITADADAGLVRLEPVPDTGPPARDVWLGVHADLRHMPRIRAVIDAIDTVFEENRCRFMGAT